MAPKLSSYEEFWPYYVSEHMEPVTRRLHILGTTLVMTCLAAAVVLDPLWLLASPLCGYGFAWGSHFWFEGNRPATFAHPLWSVRADLRMYRLTLTGRMPAELARAARIYPRPGRPQPSFGEQRA